MTLNYGAGARWFAWRHIAFAVDIRFYQTQPEERTVFYPGRGTFFAARIVGRDLDQIGASQARQLAKKRAK